MYLTIIDTSIHYTKVGLTVSLGNGIFESAMASSYVGGASEHLVLIPRRDAVVVVLLVTGTFIEAVLV